MNPAPGATLRGWRYLEERHAPPDAPDGAPPPAMRQGLREAGLL